MHKLGIKFLVFALIAVAFAAVMGRAHPAGIRVSDYHEGISNNGCFFHLGDYRGGLRGGPCGIGEAENWSYKVSLSGPGDKFQFEDVQAEPFLLGDERPTAGQIVLDRSNRLVTIDLKVRYGTNLVDFKGNGTFKTH